MIRSDLLSLALAMFAVACSAGPKPCVDDLGCVPGQICTDGQCSAGQRDAGQADTGEADGGGEDAGTGPHVISVAPADGTVRVPVMDQLDIVVTFSEPMRPQSVTLTPETTPALEITATTWNTDHTVATFSSGGPGFYDTVFRQTVTGVSTDGGMLIPFSFGFRTDLEPAAVVSWTPGPTTMADPNTRLSVTFDRPMNTATVTVETVPAIDQGTPSWTNNDRTVTYQMPASDWAFNTAYVVGIDGADTEGRTGGRILRFTTRTDGVDQTPPQVVSSIPTSGTTGIPAYTSFEPVIHFSEPMNTASLQAAVSPNDATFKIDGFDWGNNDTQLALRSYAGPIGWGTRYTIVLNATDRSGNPLPPFSFAFTTEAQGATITSWAPGDAAPAAPTERLSFTFSEPMNTGMVDVQVADVNSGNMFDIDTGTWSNGDQTLSFLTPPSNWTPGAQYTVQVDGRDATGRHTVAILGFLIQN